MTKRLVIPESVGQELGNLFGNDSAARRDFQRGVKYLVGGQALPNDLQDHLLRGELRGWRAFAIGQQQDGQGVRVIYFVTPTRVNLVAVGPHDAAYSRAKVARARSRRK